MINDRIYLRPEFFLIVDLQTPPGGTVIFQKVEKNLSFFIFYPL